MDGDNTAAAQAAAFLDRDAIMAAEDRRYDAVPVPEWGGTVRIASMGSAGRLAYEDWVRVNCELEPDPDSEGRSRVKRMPPERDAALAAIGMVDADGRRLFMMADVVALAEKHPDAIQRVANAVARLNKLSETDVKALEKN